MDEHGQNREVEGPPATSARRPGWDDFERDLAATLPLLDDECLILSARKGNRFVQFSADPRRGVRAETVSNAYLETGDRLDDGQVAALVALGWAEPTHAPGSRSPVPHGSPNFFREFAAPCPVEEAARLAVRTLSEIHRIPAPEALEYQAFDEAGNPVVLPGLRIEPRTAPEPAPGPRPRRSGPSAFVRLQRQVLRAARRITGLEGLEYQGEGNLAVPVGGRTGTVRPYGSPSFVRVYCQLAAHVEADEDLLARMHQVNARLALARVIHADGGVFLGVDFPAAPFHADHLAQAIVGLARLADEVLEDLRLPGAGTTPTVN
jgi:hypothetical protein